MMLDPADGSGPPHEASLLRFGAGFYVAWAVGYPLTQTVVVPRGPLPLGPAKLVMFVIFSQRPCSRNFPKLQ